MPITTNKVALQTLQDYLIDVKPYHTKLRALQADYVFEDQLDINFIEDTPFTQIDLQNYWTKDHTGGWRLINVSDGSAASKKYRIPATVIPRFSINSYNNQMIVGDDPATLPGLDETPWFDGGSSQNWKNHWSYSHQRGSDQAPHPVPIKDTAFELLSYTSPNADKLQWQFQFRASFKLAPEYEVNVLGYDISNAPICNANGALLTNGVDYSHNVITNLVTLLHNVAVDVHFDMEGWDTTGFDTTDWGSGTPIVLTASGYGVSWSATLSGSDIPNFNWLVNNLSLSGDQTPMKQALRPYVLELLNRRPFVQPVIFDSGQYSVPLHNGSYITVDDVPQVFGTDYIVNKTRDRVIFLPGRRPAGAAELRINYFTVDWLLISVNAPFEAHVATTYDDNSYDIPKYDSQGIGQDFDSDYFTLIVDHDLPERHSVTFHSVTENLAKGELSNVAVAATATEETWTITAETSYLFTVVGSISGALPNIHPLGGTGNNQAIYGRPFDNGKISFTIKNVFHPYYIVPDLYSYASMDYEMYNVFMYSGTREYTDFLPSLNVETNHAPPLAVTISPATVTGGKLDGSNKSYKVTIVTRAAESLPTTVTLAGGANNAAILSWSDQSSAIAYNVYGRVAGIETLLARIPRGVTSVTDLGDIIRYTDPISGFNRNVVVTVSSQVAPSSIPTTLTNPPVHIESIGKITLASETNNATSPPTANQRYWIFEFDEPPTRGSIVEFIIQQNDQFNTLMMVNVQEKFKVSEHMTPHEWVDLVQNGYDIPDFDTKAYDGFNRNGDGSLATNDNLYTRTGIVDDLYYKLLAAAERVSQYASWNPADKDTDVTLSNFNLWAKIVGAPTDVGAVRADLSKSAGKWYWELRWSLPLVNQGPACRLGVGRATAPIAQHVGTTADSWAFNTATGLGVHNNNIDAAKHVTTFNPADKGTAVTLSNGDLTVTTTNTGFARSVYSHSFGFW